jgi:hypothetical protein
MAIANLIGVDGGVRFTQSEQWAGVALSELAITDAHPWAIAHSLAFERAWATLSA